MPPATPARATRPVALGLRHAVSAGHPQAALAALRVLESGGNAVDAAAAGGICLAVVHPDIVNFAGVVAIILHDAARRETTTIAGLGPWPRRAELDYFRNECGGTIPDGLARCVVPGAPDAWLAALEHHGTLGFAEVAEPAIELARAGCPVSAFVAANFARYEDSIRAMPSSAALYMPNGRLPALGERLALPELAATLAYLADQDRAARRHGRAAGLAAVREAFYRGDIATVIDRYSAENGGLITREDLARFRATIEAPLWASFAGHEVATCGFWCQGPALLQMLSILASAELERCPHNDDRYLHLLVEAVKLAMADRHAFYGDPRYVDVPAEGLLDPGYGAERLRLIDPRRAWPDMPPAGDPRRRHGLGAAGASSGGRDAPPARNTSTIAVVDAAGNACAATVSDVAVDTPVVPGLGFPISSRGGQGWLDPGHPGVVGPGRRPWLTASPAILFRGGRPLMPFCSAGGDVQPQAMLQVLLNRIVFRFDPQYAVEAPRFDSRSFPESFWPHEHEAGRLQLENGIGPTASAALAERGHRVAQWDDLDWRAGSVSLVWVDEQGVRWGAADPRRDACALAR